MHDCYGSARSGETVAFMGPSGASKSTLLEILYGYHGSCKAEGRVTLDGTTVSRGGLKRISSMVTQQDAFIPTLSVWETLLFRANLTTAIGAKDVQQSLESILGTTGDFLVHFVLGRDHSEGIDLRFTAVLQDCGTPAPRKWVVSPVVRRGGSA
jgi:ABC-type sugar transport system ATPase subunit